MARAGCTQGRVAHRENATVASSRGIWGRVSFSAKSAIFVIFWLNFMIYFPEIEEFHDFSLFYRILALPTPGPAPALFLLLHWPCFYGPTALFY